MCGPIVNAGWVTGDYVSSGFLYNEHVDMRMSVEPSLYKPSVPNFESFNPYFALGQAAWQANQQMFGRYQFGMGMPGAFMGGFNGFTPWGPTPGNSDTGSGNKAEDEEFRTKFNKLLPLAKALESSLKEESISCTDLANAIYHQDSKKTPKEKYETLLKEFQEMCESNPDQIKTVLLEEGNCDMDKKGTDIKTLYKDLCLEDVDVKKNIADFRSAVIDNDETKRTTSLILGASYPSEKYPILNLISEWNKLKTGKDFISAINNSDEKVKAKASEFAIALQQKAEEIIDDKFLPVNLKKDLEKAKNALEITGTIDSSKFNDLYKLTRIAVAVIADTKVQKYYSEATPKNIFLSKVVEDLKAEGFSVNANSYAAVSTTSNGTTGTGSTILGLDSVDEAMVEKLKAHGYSLNNASDATNSDGTPAQIVTKGNERYLLKDGQLYKANANGALTEPTNEPIEKIANMYNFDDKKLKEILGSRYSNLDKDGAYISLVCYNNASEDAEDDYKYGYDEALTGDVEYTEDPDKNSALDGIYRALDDIATKFTNAGYNTNIINDAKQILKNDYEEIMHSMCQKEQTSNHNVSLYSIDAGDTETTSVVVTHLVKNDDAVNSSEKYRSKVVKANTKADNHSGLVVIQDDSFFEACNWRVLISKKILVNKFAKLVEHLAEKNNLT